MSSEWPDAPVAVDPYRRCIESCSHDLAPGLLVLELVDRDGPHPGQNVILPNTLLAWAGARAANR